MMNPEKNVFEKLQLPEGFQEELHGPDFAACLLRPDGSPVPEHWPVFREGERITIKNYTFKVAHIGESHLLLEPVGIVEIGKKHRDVLESNPKRKRR